MRQFTSLADAVYEVRRDCYKSTPVEVTRVQQREGLDLTARERLGYHYVVTGGWPDSPGELVRMAIDSGYLPYWKEHAVEIEEWLTQELELRTNAEGFRENNDLSETAHPALQTTIEGNWPSYTYTERLYGAIPTICDILTHAPDSRRAFWSVWQPQDSRRAMSPTRVPCSLGYHFCIRDVNGTPTLMTTYLQRSADFDIFWLSDIWFAYKLAQTVREKLWLSGAPAFTNLQVGPVQHMIMSFHSFLAEGQEIY